MLPYREPRTADAPQLDTAKASDDELDPFRAARRSNLSKRRDAVSREMKELERDIWCDEFASKVTRPSYRLADVTLEFGMQT